MAVTAVPTGKNHFEGSVALANEAAPLVRAFNYIDLIIRVCGSLSDTFNRLSLANGDRKRNYENRFEALGKEHAKTIGQEGWVKGLAGLATIVGNVALVCFADKKYQKVGKLLIDQIHTAAEVYSNINIQQVIVELQNKENLLLSKIQRGEDLDKNTMQEIANLLKTILHMLLESAGR